MKNNIIILLAMTVIAASSPAMQIAYMQETAEPTPTFVPEPTPLPTAVEPLPTVLPSPTGAATEPTPEATAAARIEEVATPAASPEAGLLTAADLKPVLPMVSALPEPQSANTSPALSTATVTNTVNTNAVGGEPVIMLDAAKDKTLDLSGLSVCQTGINQANITIDNNAVLRNLINIFTGTGVNAVGADGSVETGDAAAQANVANLVNTNLIGSCWNFTLLNFFNGMEGNIVLPYEPQFLNLTANGMRPAFPLQDATVHASNSSTLKNDLLAASNTGANTAGTTEAGNADTKIDARETVNTNRYGNNWLFVQVETGTGWNGVFENWQGDTVRTPTGGYAWMKLPDALSPPGETNIDIINSAYVENGIRVGSDTGNNTAGANGSVKTGSAFSGINLFDFINTNIIGNNWYFAHINLFGGFNGNVVFARPDLAVAGSTQANARAGETVSQTVSLMNAGTHTAQNARLVVSLPSGTTCKSVSPGACSDGAVTVNLGDMAPGVTRNVSMEVRVDNDVAAPAVTTSWTAQTVTDEPAKDNNTLLLTTQLTKAAADTEQPVSQQAAASSSVQPENRVNGTLLKRDNRPQIRLADYRDGKPGKVIGIRTGLNGPGSLPFRINFINILYVLVAAGIILRIVRFVKKRTGMFFVKRRLWRLSGTGSLV